MSISSKNNDHLQSAANNCLNSVLCVPFTDKNQGRKLSDSDIHEVAKEEGEYEKRQITIMIINGFHYCLSSAHDCEDHFHSRQIMTIITKMVITV